MYSFKLECIFCLAGGKVTSKLPVSEDLIKIMARDWLKLVSREIPCGCLFRNPHYLSVISLLGSLDCTVQGLELEARTTKELKKIQTTYGQKPFTKGNLS